MHMTFVLENYQAIMTPDWKKHNVWWRSHLKLLYFFFRLHVGLLAYQSISNKRLGGKVSGPPSRKKLWENSVGWFRMKWMEVGKCEDVTDRISHRRKVVALQHSSTPEMFFGESLGIWLTAIGEKWSMLPVYEQKIGRVTIWWCKYS